MESLQMTKSGKPKATVLAVGSPPAEHQNPTAPVIDDSIETSSTPANLPFEAALAVPGTDYEPGTPSIPLSEPRTPMTSTPRTDERFRSFRSTCTSDDALISALMKKVQELRQTVAVMNNKLDSSNRRTASLELQVKTVLANTNVLIDVTRKLARESSVIPQMPSGSGDDPSDSSTPQGIPEEFQLEDSNLRKLLRESGNAGNFAVILTRKLFPELFGEGDVRFDYNWYGGGKHSKKELDPTRKQIIRRYVCFFFPEFKSEDAWKERIVTKINECLRV